MVLFAGHEQRTGAGGQVAAIRSKDRKRRNAEAREFFSGSAFADRRSNAAASHGTRQAAEAKLGIRDSHPWPDVRFQIADFRLQTENLRSGRIINLQSAI